MAKDLARRLARLLGGLVSPGERRPHVTRPLSPAPQPGPSGLGQEEAPLVRSLPAPRSVTMSARTARKYVATFVLHHSYHRRPNPERRERDGHRKYKKGWELRLVATTEQEARKLRQALHVIGIEAGQPFPKARQTIVPVYGRDQVVRLSKIASRFKKPTPHLPE